MKFSFENFGYIDDGTVDLADLTLICGPNNVGKTYVSYAIYGFFKHFRRLVDPYLDQEEIETLIETGSIEVDLKNLTKHIAKCFDSSSKRFSSQLDQFFNAPDDFFKKASMNFSFDDIKPQFNQAYKQKIQFGKQGVMRFDKPENNSLLTIVFQLSKQDHHFKPILQDVISEQVALCLFSHALPAPFVVTSERTGIALFYKELDISKNAMLEHLVNNEEVNPIDLLNSLRSRYAEPIKDNIDIIRDYDNLNKRKSFLARDKKKYKAIFDALQGLIGGSFKIVNGQVLYRPRKERGRNEIFIPVYLSSSSVKSLFLIDFYINSLASSKGLLIIDEPELNLHPDNQRKMAGLLARLVNVGIKVLVTTHSDYLVREINNRIMLSNTIGNKENLLKKNKLCKEDILKPEQVKAYTLGLKHNITPINIDQYGIKLSVFDELIQESNQLSDDIYYSIGEE
jgi:predicted ATP-dependent endonuclease of OLD family